MDFMISASDYILPVFIVYILVYGAWKRIKVYDAFVEGVKEGFAIVVNIAPTLVGLLFAVSFARISGFLNIISSLISPFASLIRIPAEVIPLAIVKMFSSSAATGIALDIFSTYGPDSYLGLTASIMLSCTETIFYTMSVYFMAVKVTKTRWTAAGAIFASLVGIAASVLLAGAMS